MFIDNNNPDILLISETKLNPTHKLNFIGYSTIRTDRPNSIRGGDTAIIAKEDIPYDVIQHTNTSKDPTIETAIIRIKSQNTNLFIIS